MQDNVLMEKIQAFDREKIPARNVHALGTGAYGKFTVTNDISKYCKAALFNKVGKETELFARLSGTFTEQGDPDTTRDIRGFAMKFYTEEGNWDLLTINLPVFNARDMKAGPDGVHASKRDPVTANWYPTQTWDFFNTHPEALQFMMMMWGDRVGTPMSFRYMHAYGCNTYSMVNAQNERFWIKFHLVCPRGEKGFTAAQAKLVAGEDPNFLTKDLHEAIEKGNFPTWKMCIQVMPEAEGYKHPWTFDCTKVWKHDDYPLIEIGTIELNKNIVNYFSEVEQVAFSPARIVPGISFSPDRLLQGRLLVYDDTQNHRLGPNFQQIPINMPHGTEVNTNYYGGSHNLEIRNKFPHYYPSMFGGLQPDPKYRDPGVKCDGPADYYPLEYEGTDFDYYDQPRDFWNTLADVDKQHLCQNIAISIEKTPEIVITTLLGHLNKITPEFAKGVSNILKSRVEGTSKMTEGELLLTQLQTAFVGK